MIKLRLNPFSNTEEEIEVKEGELLGKEVERILLDKGFKKETHDKFHVVIDGKEVDLDLVSNLKVSDSENILIVPKIQGGNFGQIFKTVAIIAVTVAATVALPGSGAFAAGTFGGSLLVAGATIGATLLLNSLIPPPNQGLGDLGGLGDGLERSQMYSLGGQSNQAKPFQVVPKVYGTFKLFPNVAAQPYTSIEVDNSTGKLVQSLYVIYDFGLGPMEIKDLKIGDTPVENFDDIEYNFVDPNKPLIDEGPWDSQVLRDFQIYKGDVVLSESPVSINKNREGFGDEIGSLNDYQVVRNGPSNPENLLSEISLNLTFPRGLVSFNGQGNAVGATVELEIEFAEIGTNDWRAYNDPSFVSSFDSTGGRGAVVGTRSINLFPFTNSGNPYTPIGNEYETIDWDLKGGHRRTTNQSYGFNKGSNKVYTASEVFVGENFILEGSLLGRISAVTPITIESINDLVSNSVSLDLTLDTINNTLTLASGNWNSYVIVGRTITVSGFANSVNNTRYFVRAINSTTEIEVEAVDQTLTLIDETGSGNSFIVDGQSVVNNGFEATLDALLPRDYRVFESFFRVPEFGGNTVGITGSVSGRVSVGTPVFKKAFISANEQSQYFAEFRFKPRLPGEYKVRITRVRTTFGGQYQKIADLTFLSTTTRYNNQTIKTNLRHTFLELKIRATNQINGNLDTVNAIVSSILPVYDETTSTWNLEKTSNPAWIFADILTGEVNKRPISQDRLHLPSLLEWASYADEIPVTPPNALSANFVFPRFQTNFILDFSTSLKELIQSIGGATQASLNIIDGKYGVLIDKQKNVPVQVFTPRNYSNFSSTRSYGIESQGLRVKYNDPNDGYRLTELPVYNDGFDETTVTQELEELRTFGVTNPEQAWRFGRYMLAQAELRQENISIQVDFENLVCTRGDYVQFTQDAMKVGGRPARVSSISGNRITIDDGIDTQVGPSYGYVFRGVGGIETSTLTPVTSDTFDLDGTLPSVGDLIVIGEVDSIVLDCIVKSITPVDDLRATITLVEKADGILESLETGTIPDYNPLLTDAALVSLDAPGPVENLDVVDNYFEVGEGRFNYFLEVAWNAPLTGGIPELYEIYVDRGEGFELWDSTKEVLYTYEVDRAFLGIEHCFKVLAVSSGGRKINLGEADTACDTPLRKVTPPSNVEELNINITNQVIGLDWKLLPVSEGIGNYFLRFNPTLEGTWETSVPLLTADAITSTASVQGRRGTYLIKAVDFEGNESAIETIAITSIPELFDLNVVENINDEITWNGVFDRTELFGDTIILSKDATDAYYPEGFYYYEAPLDLGLNYTVRLQSLIEAGGYTENDLMVNWNPLSAVTSLSTVASADWNVETQVRYNDRINFIETWQPLSDVTALNEGDIDDWQDYTTFINGDFTGKVFQFRLRLISNLVGVTPRIFDGLIKADMPDRIEDGNNILSDIAGTDIVYDPAFYGPGTTPSIQITQDTAQSGDYYVITNKTLDGFTITFYDSTNTAVQRQFDYQVKGYGRKNDTFI